MKNAVIYARVSTEDQRENGTSLESQEIACQRYAEANDYKVVEMIKESKSGASLNRPGLDRVRELVREGVAQAVIFYALDRLSRDETDTLILAREFRAKGAELKCATTPLEDTPQGQSLLTMLAAVGKLERAGILERTMRGKRQTVRNGRIMRTKIALYGFSWVEGDGVEAHYEICEEEAVIVRSVFEWYCVEGLSLRSITARLVERGVPTKQGGHWAPTVVRRILTQEAYTGEYWWAKEVTTGGHRSDRPRSEWIGPVHVPPIIDRDLLEAAQERVQHNKAHSARRCKSDYLLRGMITCGLCGRRLAGGKVTKKGSEYTYYRCSKQSKACPGDSCPAARVRGRKAEEKAWEWVINRLSDPNFIEGILKGSGEGERAQRERDQADIRSLLGLRTDLERDENKLIELYTQDLISLDKFRERKGALDERRQGVGARLAEIEARGAARERAVQDLENAKAIVREVQEGLPRITGAELSFKDKRAVLDALHIKATATQDGDINITGFISPDLLKLVGADGIDGAECVVREGSKSPRLESLRYVIK
jgi:site-specific DNA recombinase